VVVVVAVVVVVVGVERVPVILLHVSDAWEISWSSRCFFLFLCIRVFGSWVCVVVICGSRIMGVSERTSLTVSSSGGGEALVVETWGLRGCGGEWRWLGGSGLLDPLLLLLLELIQQPIRWERRSKCLNMQFVSLNSDKMSSS
jgi:hypothetical protein